VRVAASNLGRRLLRLINTECVVRDAGVRLSSGRVSDIYIDLRRVTLGWHNDLVGQAMDQLTEDWEYEAIGGVLVGGLPIAMAMQTYLIGLHQVNTFAVRSVAKDHGLAQVIEGPSIVDRSVLIVDDVCTSGASLINAVKVTREAGAVVVGVAVLLDRGGLSDATSTAGVAGRSLFTMADMVDH
jgi:orotate phosphoribosyltransferase